MPGGAAIEPAFEYGGVSSYVGDCRKILQHLPSASVNCVVTSPPYWALRDYQGPELIWGGDPDCVHEWGAPLRTPWANAVPGPSNNGKQPNETRFRPKETGPFCAFCGAWRGQLGLEPTPELFIENMVSVFREVHRVLADDGVLWLNMGDCYCGGGRGEQGKHGEMSGRSVAYARNRVRHISTKGGGLKNKDLVGLPWMLAFALRADGWYLRCDCIWEKPNPMPESIKDRPARNHEYLFLLSKSERYFFDAKAIQEPVSGTAHSRGAGVHPKAASAPSNVRSNADWARRHVGMVEMRNPRTVMQIATQPCHDAHFATFPEELARRCILSGCPSGGVVLDLFGGSGTTALVARKQGRRAILCDSNPDYIEIRKRRLNVAQGVLFS